MAEHLVVGVARFVLRFPGCRSLKEKRRVLHSVQDRLRARHRVSCAEIGAQDEHARAVLALGLVGSDKREVEAALGTMLAEVDRAGLAPMGERVIRVEVWGDSLAEPGLALDFDLDF
ncbi:MAG: DUF503 domain-containing protein [Pseudomonadota bacterium]